MLSDDAYTDHVRRLRSALRSAPAHLYTHNDTSPQRRAARQDILDDAWSELGGDDIPKGRQGLILGGLPGSGKTQVRQSAEVPGVGPVSQNFLPIDADYFKGKIIDAGLAPHLPGFAPMETAPLMHKESNDLAKELARRAYKSGTNLAWDATLRHPHSPDSRMAEFDHYGYTPHGIYVHADPATALARVTKRHRDDLEAYLDGQHPHGGRYVPPEVIGDSLHGDRIANREHFDALAPHLATAQILDTSAKTGTRLAADLISMDHLAIRGRPNYLDDPNYVPPWTPKKPTYCQCGDRWLHGHGRYIIDRAERASHVPVQPGTPEHAAFEEEDFSLGGWSTPENSRTCSCGDPWERDHAFMGPSHRPVSVCQCGESWDREHAFLNGKHRPGYRQAHRRTAEFSSQPLNITNDYSMAAFFQWCAHNRKQPSTDNLAEFAAVSGMGAEDYIDNYLFLSREAGRRRTAAEDGPQRLMTLADIAPHLGIDRFTLYQLADPTKRAAGIPTPTHQAGPYALWDSAEPWLKWNAVRKGLSNNLGQGGNGGGYKAGPTGGGWGDWAAEFQTGEEPQQLYTAGQIADHLGATRHQVKGWAKRQDSPRHTHTMPRGDMGLNQRLWDSLDGWSKWHQERNTKVMPGSPEVMRPGDADVLAREFTPPSPKLGPVPPPGSRQ